MANYKMLVYQKELKKANSIWRLHYHECNLTHKQIRVWGEKVASLLNEKFIRFAYVGESYPGEIFVEDYNKHKALELIISHNLHVR